MPLKLRMGNEAIALGALHAGISVATGYPGTPSSEILETVARECTNDVHVEWSVNEKVALEVAAGASYAGARTLVTMKQVGLNVASDPLMSLAYIGIKGGMVIVVADDPGPISSQTEQDTRSFARYSKLPIFDPATPKEAFEMMNDAFELSEKYKTPVLFRPTTRLCHATAVLDIPDTYVTKAVEGFMRDPKWIIFPRLALAAHTAIEKRNPLLGDELSSYRFNSIEGTAATFGSGAACSSGGRLGIATSGVNFMYVKEALKILGADCRILKVATPFPFPYKLAEELLDTVDSVLVVEELDPVIERELVYLCGKLGRSVKILGKETGFMPPAGENTVEGVVSRLAEYLNVPYTPPESPELPELPVRAPVLCAGCPHRASFYAVKRAMMGKKTVFGGDIGCYTLGNAMPLDMVDTCLCMGAGFTLPQGIWRTEKDTTAFGFVGDSTFFASGITGLVNAVFNKADIVLVVLDNSITAMTGGQTHPGIGKTVTGEDTVKISIAEIVRAVGITPRIVNPFDLDAAMDTVKDAAEESGVRVIIFEASCVNITKPTGCVAVDENKCTGCRLCVSQLGCPALHFGDKVKIDIGLCTGCGLCAEVCPAKALEVQK